MIYLTAELAPSGLFYIDTPFGPVQQLLESARECCGNGDLKRAERCARDAWECSREARAHVERAAALIHLSDVYREAGKLGPALRHARDAYAILQRQPGLAQRHNEAVAAYSLGLIHHLLGNDADALNWYQTAQRLFELAGEYWATCNERARRRTCTCLLWWIRSLSGCLVRARERDGFCSTVIFPARLMGGEDGVFSLVELRVAGRVLGQQLTIGERAFRVCTSDGEGVVIEDEERYRVFQVPEPVCPHVGAQQGDHVLVQHTTQEEPDLPYCVVEGEAGAEFGRFRRDEAGEVVFESLVSGRIIGGLGGDGLPFYRPVALLRPAD
jgi:hypothetical protein